ncbi:MAG: GNAT family N-acetyltransferase [Geminicoccaceae bacterium]
MGAWWAALWWATTGIGAGSTYAASDAAARSRGIGRQLLQEAETWLRDRGVRKVQLLVRQAKVGVVAFYERLGFERSDVVVMQRWLDRS